MPRNGWLGKKGIIWHLIPPLFLMEFVPVSCYVVHARSGGGHVERAEQLAGISPTLSGGREPSKSIV